MKGSYNDGLSYWIFQKVQSQHFHLFKNIVSDKVSDASYVMIKDDFGKQVLKTDNKKFRR